MFKIMIKKVESEKDLEARLVSEVKKLGGLALKYTSQFHRGIPDRIVFLPYHTIAFVELKSTGKTPTKLQHHAMKQLQTLGFRCYVMDNSRDLDDFLSTMRWRIEKMAKAAGDLEPEPTPEQIDELVRKFRGLE